MSTDPYASIGYGYSLGGPDDGWKVTTLDDGEGWRKPEPRPTWLNDDATDEYGDRLDFDEQTIRVLYAATPAGQRVAGESDYSQRKAVEAYYGITVERSGTYEHPGWLLVAADSVQTVEWSEVIDVTGATDVSLGTMLGWTQGLEKAVVALGGPKALAQNGPRWLAWPEYR